MNIAYFQDDWRHKIVPTPRWKRYIYKMILPLLSIGAERHLTGEYWHLHPRRVIGRKGLPIEERREWVNRRHPIRGKTLLVQGTGTGWDVVSWARYRPAVIIGIDLFEFDEWPAICL